MRWKYNAHNQIVEVSTTVDIVTNVHIFSDP